MYPLLCFLSAFILGLYIYFKYEMKYWNRRHVPNEEGTVVVGNIGRTLLMKKSSADIYSELYKKFRDYKYFGFYQSRIPALMIVDLDMIKDILIRNFNNFHDVPILIDEKRDPILTKNPFFAKGEKWKLIRAQLTPQFTAGKIKGMFPLLKDTSEKLVKYLNDEPEAIGENGLNTKKLANKFTADAVASCGFGFDGRSFVDPKADFLELGTKLFGGSRLDMVIFMMAFLFPEITKIRAPKMMPDDINERFTNIILQNLKQREENNIKRGDFLDAILEMKKTTTTFEYTTEYMLAHAMTFFSDGYETSSVVLQFVYYELGANLDVQRRLRQEIEEVMSGDYENFTYDNLQEMKYLDMIIQETLRKYPPLYATFRECTEPITLGPASDGGRSLQVEKGVQIFIPVMAIHYDPTYYPDPDRFDPERFRDDLIESRPKYTYLPFGEGPRMCLGQRFGITQIKVAVVATIRNFEIRVNQKTKLPFVWDPSEFILGVKGGVWANFYKLENK